jgi:hypothetical protein
VLGGQLPVEQPAASLSGGASFISFFVIIGVVTDFVLSGFNANVKHLHAFSGISNC